MLMGVVVGHTQWIHIGDAECFEVCAAKTFLKAENFFNADLSFLAHEFTFPEVFYYEFCKDLDVKGRVVAHIGAYAGSTTMYFLLREAEHVYAAEPNPMTQQFRAS